MIEGIAFIIGFIIELALEVIFAIVVRIPQFFFDLLTKICNGIEQLVKGRRSNESLNNH